MVFSGYMPSSGIAGSYGSSIFGFGSRLLGRVKLDGVGEVARTLPGQSVTESF